MKNYYEKLKPFFEKQITNLVIKTPLPLQKYEHVFIPQEFENKTRSEQQSLTLKGSYKIKVYENASNTILFVTLSCKNIEYLIVSKLVHNSLCIDLNETESNSTDMKEYSFNIESFVARSRLRSQRNAITLKLISHFNTAQIEIVISPGDITYGG